MCLIAFVSSRVKMDDLMRQVTLKNFALISIINSLRSDVFGEKLITITGHEMNQTQIQSFLSRMRALETGIGMFLLWMRGEKITNSDYTDTEIDTETEKAKVDILRQKIKCYYWMVIFKFRWSKNGTRKRTNQMKSMQETMQSDFHWFIRKQ